MPIKLHWTEYQDEALRRLRRGGASWATIALACGVSRNAALERAKKLRIRIEPKRAQKAVRVPDLYERPPLPPGHPECWALLTRGTLLEGTPFVSLGAIGRTRGKVIGDS